LEKTVLLRRHQGEGKTLVAKGERVLPDTVLVEGDTPSGFKPVYLAESLAVSPGKAESYLLKKPGEKVRRGEQIAHRKKIFGFGASDVFSPIDGQIKEYNSQTGILLLQFLSKHEQVHSGVWGVVEAVEGSEVVVRTKMLEIYGVVGSGRVRLGEIRVIAKEDEFLLASQIDENCSGKILVGGGLVSSESFSKALVVGASGLVTAGMHAKDFWAVGGGTVSAFSKSSDVGITAVLMEGFGHLHFFENIYRILAENENKIAFIDGDSAKVSIPLQKEPDPVEKIEFEEEAPRSEKLKVGDLVRTIGCCNLGIYGKVKSIGNKKMVFESGLSDYFVEVETLKGVIEIPPCNLEILI